MRDMEGQSSRITGSVSQRVDNPDVRLTAEPRYIIGD